MKSNKVEFFNKLSFVLLLATICGSIFFFVPFAPVSLEASKGFLISVGITLSVFFWLIARLGEGKFSVPKDKVLLFGAMIPVSFLIASFFSSSLYISLFGSGFEVGTFGTMLILFILFFLSSLYFQTEKRITYFLNILFISAGVLMVFELVNMFIGFGKFSKLFIGISSGNLLGSWSDFAIFFGLITLLSLFAVEFRKTALWKRVALYILLALGVFFLIVINIPLVWLLVGLFSVLIFVYSISITHSTSGTLKEAHAKNSFPFASLIVILVSLVFLVGSNSIGNFVSRYISVVNPDVRPSLVATSKVAYKALAHNPLFGTGPNTFIIDWALWQPKEIAQSLYWNIDFPSGVGLLPTFVVTTGVVGLAMWVLFIFYFVKRTTKNLGLAFQSMEMNYMLMSTFLVSVYSWLITILYSPTIVMLMLAFASSGVMIALLISKKKVSVVSISFLSDPRHSFFSILGIMVLMVTSVSLTYVYIEKFTSVIYFSRGIDSGSTIETLSKSETMLSNALLLDKNDAYYRTLSQVYIREIGVLINDKTVSADALKTNVQKLVNLAQVNAQSAVAQNPKQYQNYVNLGNVYASLVPLSVANSYEGAVAAYDQAMKLAPQNPSIILARAQLEFAHKNNDDAKKFIAQALALKPNYTDAIFFLVQIQASEGNLADAIAQAQHAGDMSPNDPTIFFRLGLLRYNNNDYTGAVSAFENAVLLDNTYINAHYFLGLAYQKAGRSTDAIAQFQALQKVLPDNADIKDALNSAMGVSAPAQPTTTTAAPTKTPAKAPVKKAKTPLPEKL